MLKTALSKAMQDRGLSSHSAADLIGVSHTTILRALRGDAVDVDTIIKIANFLNVRPSELINSMSDASSLADDLAVLLAHSADLERVLSETVQKVKEGSLNPAILKEIVDFAVYKFQSEGGATPNVGRGSSRAKQRSSNRRGGGRTSKA